MQGEIWRKALHQIQLAIKTYVTTNLLISNVPQDSLLEEHAINLLMSNCLHLLNRLLPKCLAGDGSFIGPADSHLIGYKDDGSHSDLSRIPDIQTDSPILATQ